MLAYPIQEADELLESKLKAAKTSLANCEEDLDFLREQVTVCFCILPNGSALVTWVYVDADADADVCRPWKLLLRGCITGMLSGSAGRRRRMRRRERAVKGMRMRGPMVEFGFYAMVKGDIASGLQMKAFTDCSTHRCAVYHRLLP
jgi:hypothetical protein